MHQTHPASSSQQQRDILNDIQGKKRTAKHAAKRPTDLHLGSAITPLGAPSPA